MMLVAYAPDALVYAAGSNTWQVRADFDPNVHRVEIEFSDDDAYFDGDAGADEVGSDTSQTATVTDMAGNPVASGRVYDEEFYAIYDGVNPTIWIERVEIDGQLVGYLVSEPLLPGAVYTQSTVADVDGAPTAATYDSFQSVPCYAPGTLIDTPQGPRAVEWLKPGDQVMTRDRGLQPIRWARRADHPLDNAKGGAGPVLIKAGALGRNLPAHDLIVSPQHRILVGGAGQLQPVFANEAFAPAKSLTAMPGIRHMNGMNRITWIHFACDRHEIVMANGCLSESLLLGPMVLNGLRPAERQELSEIFGPAPRLDMALNGALNGPAALNCLSVGAARCQVAGYLKNQRRESPGAVFQVAAAGSRARAIPQ